jgi:IS605 OrfB family transposase
MNTLSTYSVKIKEYRRIFKDSVRIYRSAVDFFIDVCLKEWGDITPIKGLKAKQSYVEKLTVPTSGRPNVVYNFNQKFYKMPYYLRRAAISEAIGKVSSYKSNLLNWEYSDKRERGLKPSLPKAGFCYPVLYRDNMYVRKSDYIAQIKVFRNNTWDWITIQLRKSDVDYILHHCKGLKECAPTLQKRGKCWYLDFAFEQSVKLVNTPIREQTILSVDLGINSSATCTVMRSDGTVLGRRFLHLPKEYDSLKHKIGHIKRAQRHGSRAVTNLWNYAKGVNNDIAVKTAKFIMENAILHDVNVIVFEHLNLGKKKRGSQKQKLALWKARYVQQMVEHKAHVNGIRISHINAWNTSKLAFDGSGTVLRGNKSEKTNGSYSVCEFQNGKIYNCDLSASYNIGARYFVREILKTLPVTERQRIEAKVPGCAKRSTCTLATLISLNGELDSAESGIAV